MSSEAEDLIQKEIEKSSHGLKANELYDSTGLSPRQVANGIRNLIMKKKVSASKKGKEYSYEKID